MKNILYISHKNAYAVRYVKKGKKVIIKDYVCEALDEGTVINGVITDKNSLAEKLQQMKSKKPKLFKSIVLLLDSSSIAIKKIDAPKLTKAQYIRLIKEELNDASNTFDDMVYTYFPIEQHGKINILGCGTSKEFIKSYVDILRETGIKAERICVGVESVIKYWRKRKDIREESAVCNIVDGISVLSLIFEDSVPIFISRSRVFAENAVQALGQQLVGIIQFAQANGIKEIKKAYYCGKWDEDAKDIGKYAEQYHVEVEKLDTPVENQNVLDDDAFILHMAMMSDENEIDLLTAYRDSFKKNKDNAVTAKRNKGFAVSMTLITAIILSIYGINYLSYTRALERNEEYKAKIENISKTADLSSESLSEVYKFQTRITGIEAFLTEKEKNKTLDSDLVMFLHSKILPYGSVTAMTYSVETGAVDIYCKVTDQIYASRYVADIKANKKIIATVYEGFGEKSGFYEFMVRAQIQEPQPKKEDTDEAK